MKKTACIYCWMLYLIYSNVQAQNIDSLPQEEQPVVTIGGFIDTYFGYDFSRPASKDRPYFVSSTRHNEFTINLAYLEIKYTDERVRGVFRPAIGTYMAANYSAEPVMFRNLLEANVGIKLFKKKGIWLDAGVLASPYTNEGPISKDQLTYTRSFAPEYVPYYISGLKLTIPVSKKLTSYFYLINGWQNIRENNQGKSGTLQLEYKPVEKLIVNWNLYVGDERTTIIPTNRTRIFTDMYMVFNPEGKFTGSTSVYIGAQEHVDTLNVSGNGKEKTNFSYWHNINVIGRYKFTSSLSVTGRLEFFNDPNGVQITPITGIHGFNTYSSSLGLNWAITDKVLCRIESRSFISKNQVYFNKDGNTSKNSQLLIGSMAIAF